MFHPSSPDLFFTKNDPEDIRLGDIVKQFDSQNFRPNDIAILGYPDDEGIQLNGGRTGASHGPKTIRQFLYKMTPSYLKSYSKTQIFDYGDLNLSSDLRTRHELARNHVEILLQKKLRTLSFGGGHDYGYADTAAFVETFKNQQKEKPLIINFDAHMDVRPSHKNLNSGTPFYRLYELFPQAFHLIEVGIQPQCNSPHHIKWAQDRGIEIVDTNTLSDKGWDFIWAQTALKNLKPQQPVFISFDIDALNAGVAPGCSQSWGSGLQLQDSLTFLRQLYQKCDVRGLGIYEVSPPLDRDNQTSKTAAVLAHQFIYQ